MNPIYSNNRNKKAEVKNASLFSRRDTELRRRHTAHTKNRPKTKYILRRTAAAALTIVAAKSVFGFFPQIKELLYGAALVSAAINVSDGAIETAKERFKEELAEYDDKGEEAAVIADEVQKESGTSSGSKNENNGEFDITEPLPPPALDSIPPESRGTIEERHYSAAPTSPYIQFGSGIIKNSTEFSDDAVREILAEPLEMKTEDNDEPQVLIMHTHATESYAEYGAGYYDKRDAEWRSRDNEKNVVRLGKIITDELNAAGIKTLHDETQHDYPSYNGSYARSEETVKGYLEKYPSIKVVLDVHRDAIQTSDGTVYKAISEIDGEKAAQVMIISGCDDGTMDMPEWDKNLRFAAAFQSVMEEKYPGLTRPVFFCYRQYNQHLTNGSLLLEFGSHGNILAECERTAHYVGKSLAELLTSL